MTVKALGPFILLMKSCLSLNDLLEKLTWRINEQKTLDLQNSSILIGMQQSQKTYSMTLILPSDKCTIDCILNVYALIILTWLKCE